MGRTYVHWGHRDDGIDSDDYSAGVIEYNRIADNDDDGIEVRLHPGDGGELDIRIRYNLIARNGGDGIQLIEESSRVTPRTFTIERNLIVDNVKAGIGMMPDGITNEDFGGYALKELIFIINNTIAGNNHGLCGGANTYTVNNIFLSNRVLGIKNTGPTVLNNILWNNAKDTEGVQLDSSNRTVDPMVNQEYKPTQGSPAIDAALKEFSADGTSVKITEGFNGLAPDIGGVEF